MPWTLSRRLSGRVYPQADLRVSRPVDLSGGRIDREIDPGYALVG
jgi:hypothetical protein